MGYEKFMIDADFCGALHTYLRGIDLDDEQFALDGFHEVGPGKHFFGAQHTLRHYETAFWDSGPPTTRFVRAMARRRRAAGRGARRRQGRRDAGGLRAAPDRHVRRRGAAGLRRPPQGRHPRPVVLTMNDDPLLQPFTLKHLTLRNRVFSSSHEPAYSEDGMPKDRYRLYHVEKAKGGLAMTMTAGSAVVAEDSPPAFGNLHAYADEIVPWIRRMTDEVHEHGAACMIQLTHLGRRTGWAQDDWLPVLAPSAVREPAHRAVPERGGGLGHRPHRRQVRRRRRADAGGRDGRHRDRVVRAPVRPVLVADHQPPHRRVRRLLREPAAIRLAGAHGHPRAGRVGVHRRAADGDRRAHRGRHRHADRARPAPSSGGRRVDRLRQRDPRQRRRRGRAHRGDPDPRHAVGTAPRLRRPRAGGDRPPGAARVEGRRRGNRPARDPGGQARPRRHDPGAPRRPAHHAQDHRGPRVGDPTVRRCDVLPRSDLRGG